MEDGVCQGQDQACLVWVWLHSRREEDFPQLQSPTVQRLERVSVPVPNEACEVSACKLRFKDVASLIVRTLDR